MIEGLFGVTHIREERGVKIDNSRETTRKEDIVNAGTEYSGVLKIFVTIWLVVVAAAFIADQQRSNALWTVVGGVGIVAVIMFMMTQYQNYRMRNTHILPDTQSKFIITDLKRTQCKSLIFVVGLTMGVVALTVGGLWHIPAGTICTLFVCIAVITYAERRIVCDIRQSKFDETLPFINKMTGTFFVFDKKQTTFKHWPREIDGGLVCSGNNIKSFHGIHKHIKRINGTIDCDKGTHMLGLAMIPGVKKIHVNGDKHLTQIFQQFLHDPVLLQDALIDGGYPEQGKL